MKDMKIQLRSTQDIMRFNKKITKYECDFDIEVGHNYVDAKSIMGIFAFDLSKPLQLNIHANDNCDEITKSLKNYLC